MAAHNDSLIITPFVGRQSELVEIARLLDDPACRLLTLVGPGGMGKTRLALEMASALGEEYPHGVYFCALQALTSPDYIVPAIADALHFRFYPSADPKQQLLDYLQEKTLLLVLDNFEHLMDGVDLVSEFLATAPHLKVLATSRERLRLHEEWVFDVIGLSVPRGEHVDSLDSYSAVQLFLENARRVGYRQQSEDAAHIVRICQLVEGSPLAIELAAMWVRSLSCAGIAQEIRHGLDILEANVRNFPEKHRSMRSVFTYSLARCPAEERTLFGRLAVFQGGFEREAAEQVAGASRTLLASLVDRSLLHVTHGGRYSLHELLRQFGAEQLAEFSEEASQIHERHCTYYARFMKAQWPRLTGSEIKAALTAISIDLNNLRAAWDWAVRHLKAAEVEAMLVSLWFFCGVNAHQQEGAQVFAEAAAAFHEDVALRAKLMARWGELAILGGNLSKAKALLHESLPLLRRVGARGEIAFVLYRLVLYRLPLKLNFDMTEAASYLEQSLALYTELEDHFNMGEVLITWGLDYFNNYIEWRDPDDLQRAKQYFEKGLSAAQQCDNLFGIANAHRGLSEVARHDGDYLRALQHAQVSRKIYRDLRIGWGIIGTLAQEGFAAYKLGDYALMRWCVLENLLFILEHGFDHLPYGAYFAQNILNSLHQAAALLMTDGKQTRAYEALANLDQQFINFKTQPDPFMFVLLPLLDEPLSPSLAAAVTRGRVRDLEGIIKDVVADLTASPSADSQHGIAGLTEREVDILRLIAEGHSNQEIADQLYLARTTVKWYIGEIYSKLGVSSRTQAAARARALGLLPDD